MFPILLYFGDNEEHLNVKQLCFGFMVNLFLVNTAQLGTCSIPKKTQVQKKLFDPAYVSPWSIFLYILI